MLARKMFNKVILFSLITVFTFFLGCEKMEQQSPTAIDNTSEVKSLTKNSLTTSSSGTLDIIVTTTSDIFDFEGAQQISDLPGTDGVVSLREAIWAANNTPGPQTIGFNIPTGDIGFNGTVFTIKLTADNGYQQAILDNGTIVDGTSQTLFSGDSNPLGPEIVLDGSIAGVISGFTLLSDNNSIIGLVFNSMKWAGIQIGGNNNRICQCFIGVDETGTVAKGNEAYAIIIVGSNNLIEDNLISGNDCTTISINGEVGGGANIVQNNFIGTDRTGTKALGNGDWAICISNGSSNNVIGGTNAEERNVISGNDCDGIMIYMSSNNRIINNFIGTDVTGKNPIPNNTIEGGAGVSIGLNSQGNLIERNIIAYNLRRGILIYSEETFSAINNKITKNSIFSNDDIGIDLGNDRVTLNDPGDTDTGDNNLMNYPVLTDAKVTSGKLHIKGTIDTQNPKTVTIEFFANPVPIPGGHWSGYGQGAIYLGSDHPNPHGKINATLPTVAPGTLITATATDVEGNTSEFSAYIEAK